MSHSYLFLFISGIYAGIIIAILFKMHKNEKAVILYEYTSVCVPNEENIDRVISAWADDGWRLVSVNNLRNENGRTLYWERIKRPLLPNQ